MSVQISEEADRRCFIEKVFWGLRPATLLKKETLARLFSCEFCEISKNTYFTEHLWWLLLKIYQILHRISAVELISNKLSVSKLTFCKGFDMTLNKLNLETSPNGRSSSRLSVQLYRLLVKLQKTNLDKIAKAINWFQKKSGPI